MNWREKTAQVIDLGWAENFPEEGELTAYIPFGIKRVNDEGKLIHDLPGIIPVSTIQAVEFSMQAGKREAVMVTICEMDVFCDDTSFLGCNQDDIRLDRTSWKHDHPGADSAVMSHAATQDRTVCIPENAITGQSSEWGWNQVEIGEGRSAPNESIPANNTHLQAGVLGNHTVFH